MLIDWFTVFAEIVNFLILVVLLRWFLYKPILHVMQQRQTEMEDRWQSAERLQAEAKQVAEAYRQQQRELQHQQDQFLAQARSTADQERQRLLEQIRQEMAILRTQWQEDLWQEQEGFLRTLRQQVIHQTYGIACQALTDLANANLEHQMIQVFCDRLSHLEENQQQAITQALAQTNQTILVRSSFEMPPDLRQRLIDELHTQFPITHPVEFGTAPNLLCGIAIKLAGQEIVWSLDTYLQTLEQRLSATLTQEVASHYHDLNLPASANCLH